ncbi:MAG TPA: hypothetical protein VGR28_05270 [Candidatus Thermoplasmatota archaeon]|nr:hypothetical protein [Candidatus Thermoplasmatota archaeon]
MEPRLLKSLVVGALFLVPAGAAAGAEAPMAMEAWLALAQQGALPTDCTRQLPPELQPGTEGVNLLDACPGIRPGAQLSVGCTMNFVFTDGPNLYIGTAGHCYNAGQRASAPNLGQFGTVVFSRNGGPGNDFALIRVDPGFVADVNPTLCAFGGPVAAHNGAGQLGGLVYEYGWGIMTYLTPMTRARIHVNQGGAGDYRNWIGEGSGGDSGAPIMTSDGQAYAIHTHGITPVFGVYGEGGTYIQKIYSMVRGAGININLVPGAADSFHPDKAFEPAA